jgi:acyl carrier protein
MKDSTLRKTILQICREVNPDIPDDLDELLIDTGLVDSFGAFMILSSLEIEFNIEISTEDIKHDNFKNIRSIIELVKSYTEM